LLWKLWTFSNSLITLERNDKNSRIKQKMAKMKIDPLTIQTFFRGGFRLGLEPMLSRKIYDYGLQSTISCLPDETSFRCPLTVCQAGVRRE
jgi:hypothetical protein